MEDHDPDMQPPPGYGQARKSGTLRPRSNNEGTSRKPRQEGQERNTAGSGAGKSREAGKRSNEISLFWPETASIEEFVRVTRVHNWRHHGYYRNATCRVVMQHPLFGRYKFEPYRVWVTMGKINSRMRAYKEERSTLVTDMHAGWHYIQWLLVSIERLSADPTQEKFVNTLMFKVIKAGLTSWNNALERHFKENPHDLMTPDERAGMVKLMDRDDFEAIELCKKFEPPVGAADEMSNSDLTSDAVPEEPEIVAPVKESIFKRAQRKIRTLISN